MTSARQIAANRRNAAKSTGPKTAHGKERSRYNALRHGLTAETVIGTLEGAEDYRAFEEAIAADFDAQSAVERELVLRLAGLLWRLRRTTRIEAGLFDIQATHLSDLNAHQPAKRQIMHPIFDQSAMPQHRTPPDAEAHELQPQSVSGTAAPDNPSADLARCDLRRHDD
jgi:hypothetical protein